MINLLMACLALGYPMGMCQAIDADPEYQPPKWATPEWKDFASHIVASEARGVESADIVIACTLIRDIERGWHPWELRKRWFGWGTPDKKDIEAVNQSLTKDGCANIPEYKYVGNINDVRVWMNMRMINTGPHDLYIGYGGQTVVGIEWVVE